MVGQVDRIGRELDQATERVVGLLQLRAYQVLAIGTPVDTGFARGSLTPTTGSSPTRAVKRPASHEAASSAGRSNLNANRARAEAIASTYRLAQGRAFLTYLAGYVVYLNMGSSSQAPAMFVERGVLQAIRSVGSVNFK